MTLPGYDVRYHRKVFSRPCLGTGGEPFKPAAVLKGQFICLVCMRLVAVANDKIRGHGWIVDYIWR